jgi:hypothetical protein
MDLKRLKQIDAEIQRLHVERKSLFRFDTRVDFGEKVVFTTSVLNPVGAYIGEGMAKDGDKHKVLIANKDSHRWILFEDYDGTTAVMLIRLRDDLTKKTLK